MPVVKKVFSETEEWAMSRCGLWNGYKNLAQIAEELLINGPEFGTVQWQQVGDVFVRYFGTCHAITCHAKRDWDTIGNIVYQFDRFYSNERKEVRDGEVAKG
jgi:hypothetical protein